MVSAARGTLVLWSAGLFIRSRPVWIDAETGKTFPDHSMLGQSWMGRPSSTIWLGGIRK
jgi:hypothetical protein